MTSTSSSTSHNSVLQKIPRHFLDGPGLFTVTQSDGSMVRMSFCDDEGAWNTMMVWGDHHGHIIISPPSPISMVIMEVGKA